MFGHLNMDFVKNKFEMIAASIADFNIFLIAESKLNSIFSNMQFKINVFIRDSNRFSGSLMLYLEKAVSEIDMN